MATKNQIVHTLRGHVMPPVDDWYVGITDNPSRRKGEHGNPSHFYFEQADSEQTARDAERELPAKNCKEIQAADKIRPMSTSSKRDGKRRPMYLLRFSCL